LREREPAQQHGQAAVDSVDIVGGRFQLLPGIIDRFMIPLFWQKRLSSSDIPTEWFRGPARMPVQVAETVPWASEAYCTAMLEKSIRRYVSSFNVPEEPLVAEIISAAKAMLAP